MLQSNLLTMLRCPEDLSDLMTAPDVLIQQLNAVIRDGRLRNRAGRVLDETLDGGLIRAGSDMLYPVIRRIPILLRDEGIPLEQLTTGAKS